MDYNTNCPLFNIGKCNKYSSCKYIHHKKCKDNYVCSDENCKLGHGTNLTKRTIISNIYSQYYLDSFDDSTNKCGNPLGCTNPKCNFDHFLIFKHRDNISYIVNNLEDDEAKKYYAKKYKQNNNNNYLFSIKTLNSNNTSPSTSATSSPIIVGKSYSDSVKGQITSSPSITTTMDSIIEKRKELKDNITNMEDIKMQINALQNMVKEYEDKIENNKKQLRDLASNLAEI